MFCFSPPARFRLVARTPFSHFASLDSLALPELSPLDVSSAFYGLGFLPVRPRVCSAKRTPFFSLWLTARTTNCPSTLKKGASQSKSLLNDRVRSPFGRSLEPLLSSGRQLPPLFLLPAPRRFLPLSRQPFSPLALPCFSTARFRRVFFRLSLCRSYRRFVSPRRAACPHPAACRLRPTLRIVVSPGRAPSVCLVALSPLCPDVYTPNGFVFRTTTPCDLSRPCAGFHDKQTRPSPLLYVFNRVTSKFSPTPFARMPISPLGFERLPRANFSARASVSLLNK